MRLGISASSPTSAAGHCNRCDLNDLPKIGRFVRIYEVGSNEGFPLLALEYCEERRVEARIADTPLAPRAVVEITVKLANAQVHEMAIDVQGKQRKAARTVARSTGAVGKLAAPRGH